MRVLVVYESVLGKTRAIAEAVAAGVAHAAPSADVRCLPASRVLGEPVDADLVVVGAPTHSFGLPGERTRRTFVSRALRRGRAEGLAARLEPGAGGPGLREWFEGLSGAADGPPSLAAAFDTRLDRLLAGGSARRITRLLRRHGYRMVARPKGFRVRTAGGEICPGELERAHRWGAQLATAGERAR